MNHRGTRRENFTLSASEQQFSIWAVIVIIRMLFERSRFAYPAQVQENVRQGRTTKVGNEEAKETGEIIS